MAELKEVLKLESGRFEERAVNINGAQYKLRDPRTLSLPESNRMKRLAKLLNNYASGDMEDAEVEALLQAINAFLICAVPDIDAQAQSGLTDQDKIAVINAFFTLQGVPAPKESEAGRQEQMS